MLCGLQKLLSTNMRSILKEYPNDVTFVGLGFCQDESMRFFCCVIVIYVSFQMVTQQMSHVL